MLNNTMKKLMMSIVSSIFFAFYTGCDQEQPGSLADAPLDQSNLLFEEEQIEAAFQETVKNHQMQEGCVITSWQSDQYTESEVDDTLEKMHVVGCEWICILTTWYQDTESSTHISPTEGSSSGTPSKEGLERLILKVKLKGMIPILKPHIDIKNGEWRGIIGFDDELDWFDWFANYRQFILYYAKLAEKKQLKLFVVGTELKGTTHRPEWRSIINDVKAIFHGELVYAANHDHYQNIPFWDTLDYIGVNAYFALTDLYDPTLEQLDDAFVHITQEMREFSEAQGKNIILTELGYQSFDGTNITPWDTSNETLDEQEQADCYQATFNAFFNKDWVKGMYFWHTHYDMHDWDGFGYVNKISEEVLSDWYHRVD